MKDLLQKLLTIAQAIVKIVPVVIEILGDVLDDGQVNSSNGRSARGGSPKVKG